jgi:L-malate glycosyltransferase
VLNILYLNNQMTIGGVAKCILKLSKELREDNNIFIASKCGGALLPEFEKIGIKNIPIDCTDKKSPYNIMRNVIKIVSVVRKEKIDIIHSNHRMTTLLAKIVRKFTRVKVIHTQHAINKDKRMLTRLTLRGIKVIAVSKGVKDSLINDYKLDPLGIDVIYNGIDSIKNKMDIEDSILKYKRNGYFLIGCISRLTQNKGIEVLIDAARIIDKDKKKIKFFIIGDGDKKLELEEYCKRMNLSNIDFLGFKLNAIDYIDNFDLIVQPSFSEGLGLTAIEALSRSKPVVASDIPGLNEVVIDNYNGILFPAGDSEKLVKCIYRIYLSGNEYKKICDNAINYYNNNFNSKNYLLKHKELYNNIIAE